MCTLVEEFAKDYAKDFAKEQVKANNIDIAKTLIQMNMTNENISIATHLTIEEVEKLRKS